MLDEFHNPGLREAIKSYSQWPTIPQVGCVPYTAWIAWGTRLLCLLACSRAIAWGPCVVQCEFATGCLA